MRKWSSRRWWVCLWSMLMCTIILTWLMFSNESPGWAGIAIGLFQAIMIAYIGADSYTKPRGIHDADRSI